MKICNVNPIEVKSLYSSRVFDKDAHKHRKREARRPLHLSATNSLVRQ